MELCYRRGNLFDKLDKDVIYLHACNAQGLWGAGVATQFKMTFPDAYLAHIRKSNKCGEGYIVHHRDYKVACLITSEHYGKRKDPPKKILVQTYTALQNMLNNISENEITVYSPKINSGYFATPWDATEKVIKLACSKVNKKITWVVWEI